MKARELTMRGLGDARLAVHAAGSQPAWLWSVDGTRILWANPVAARLFGANSLTDLAVRTFGPADSHRRQIVQLAGRLRADGPLRLERLRGFGAPLGRLVTCGCTRLTLADGSDALLIVAAEPLGRPMPLSERLQRLVEDADIPLAAFGRDGVFVGASAAARPLLGFRNLSEAGLDDARDNALKTGRNAIAVGIGHLVLQRVGSGADVGLIALLEAGAVPAPLARPEPANAVSTEPVAADLGETAAADSQPDTPDATPTGEAPAEFAPADDAASGIAPLEPFPDFEQQAEEAIPPRSVPLRFVWDIDQAGHFTLRSDDMLGLLGPESAAALDRTWNDIARSGADPQGHVAAAMAAESVWSGIAVAFAADGTEERLIAELSGLPTYHNGVFAGYRGFGVVLDLDAMTRLDGLRRRDTAGGPFPQSLSAHIPSPPLAMDSADIPEQKAFAPETVAEERPLTAETPPNVVPFRASPEGHAPVLTPVENNAFNELARELSARLEADRAREPAAVAEAPPETPAPVAVPTDTGARQLLDLAPVAMAVHRDGRVLYANTAFLAASGHADLAALAAAPFDPSAWAPARHVALDWAGEAAEGVIVDPPRDATHEAQSVAAESGAADAEDLGAMLDAADEAILMFDAQGLIRASNRSAAKLFGARDDALVARPIATLFTPDTQVAITPLLERVAGSAQPQTVETRTVLDGVELPLQVTMGRVRADSPNFYAIVRDVSPIRRQETELAQARRKTERATADKADILARISHEMRAPLSAIIGFADVMIEQRFGPLGSDRYADYLRDIRGCGERVVAIVDDLLDLSQIESGRRGLAPAPQDLNDLVEQCVAAMQPQANRERIIIRSSLAHPLPHVVADGATLRQIALNLIGNSIHLANPGGQVIVSTVRADSGEVLLRVRDTGHGLNDNEMATALAPFRPAAEDADAPALIRLSLTRALAEANHARFTVKPAPYAGTLIEVAFSPDQARR